MDEYEEEEEGAELEAYREKTLRNSDGPSQAASASVPTTSHYGNHTHASGSGIPRMNGGASGSRTQAGMAGEGFEPFRTGSPIPDADGLGWPGSFLSLLSSVLPWLTPSPRKVKVH